MQELQTRIPKVVNLNEFPPPDLAIKVGDTSLSDELNRKKQLYEEVQVSEYWVVDVAKAKLSAFAIAKGKSQPITESGVLPGLAIILFYWM
jgi:Uma2 family endonuclease